MKGNALELCPCFTSPWWYPRSQFSACGTYTSTISITWKQLRNGNSLPTPEVLGLSFRNLNSVRLKVGKLLIFICWAKPSSLNVFSWFMFQEMLQRVSFSIKFYLPQFFFNLDSLTEMLTEMFNRNVPEGLFQHQILFIPILFQLRKLNVMVH